MIKCRSLYIKERGYMLCEKSNLSLVANGTSPQIGLRRAKFRRRNRQIADLAIEPVDRAVELLLVEDNHGDVLLIRHTFRNANLRHSLTVASDGEEAMSMLRREGVHAGQRTPDMILLDLNLPRMDGREVLQAIKADPNLQSIPVIVLSSSKAAVDIARSYELNADGYMVKPVTFLGLKAVFDSIGGVGFTALAPPPAPSVIL